MKKALNWYKFSASLSGLMMMLSVFSDDIVTAVVGGSFFIGLSVLIAGGEK